MMNVLWLGKVYAALSLSLGCHPTRAEDKDVNWNRKGKELNIAKVQIKSYKMEYSIRFPRDNKQRDKAHVGRHLVLLKTCKLES